MEIAFALVMAVVAIGAFLCVAVPIAALVWVIFEITF